MSRADARLKLTSSPPRKIWPEVGSSSPAIMRSVVVLPQPEGPSRQKNSPSRTLKVESFTAVKSAKALCSWWTRISAMRTASVGKLGDDHEHRSAEEGRRDRPGEERQHEGLQHHQEAERDDQAGEHLHAPSPCPARPTALGRRVVGDGRRRHLRTAPKVMPRSRCLRRSTVKN